MISALLLAASLITPPHGMGRVPVVPMAQAGISNRGARLLESYRGIAATKWENHWYKTPYYIAVAAMPTYYDPVLYGLQAIASESTYPSPAMAAEEKQRICARRAAFCGNFTMATPRPVPLIVSKPVTLCHGARGWFNKFKSDSVGSTRMQVLAQANGTLYVASTVYGGIDGDVFHAEKALLSLCPPGAAASAPFEPPAQVRAPAGWFASDTTNFEQVGDEMDARAFWARLTKPKQSLEYVLFAQASDVDENVTPEQEADLMRQASAQRVQRMKKIASAAQSFCGVKDGWHTVYDNLAPDGYTYRQDALFGYDNGMSYVLEYVRRADEKDDPAALAALRSFCPKNR